MNVVRFEPFGAMLNVRDAMNPLLEEGIVNPSRTTSDGTMYLALDMYETQDAFIIDAVLPGVKPEEVNITIQNNVLAISAETQQEPTAQPCQAHLRERRYGRFSRTISLPSQVQADQVHATLEDGILHLEIPKAERVRPRKITVNSGYTRV